MRGGKPVDVISAPRVLWILVSRRWMSCCAARCSWTSTRSCARACGSGRRATRSRSLERHHGFERLEKRVREGGGSIVAYETWCRGPGAAAQEAERRLLAHLLLYHHREAKPAWWRYFDLRGTPLAELIDDRDVLAGLKRDETRRPAPSKRSLDYAFTFPAQEALPRRRGRGEPHPTRSSTSCTSTRTASACAEANQAGTRARC